MVSIQLPQVVLRVLDLLIIIIKILEIVLLDWVPIGVMVLVRVRCIGILLILPLVLLVLFPPACFIDNGGD